MEVDKHNLELALKSHFPFIVIETHDEMRVITLLKQISNSNERFKKLRVWNASKGLDFTGNFGKSYYGSGSIDYTPTASSEDSTDPETLLKLIKHKLSESIVVLPDFHSYLTNPKVLRLVKEIGQQFYTQNITLVFISHAFNVPDEIERMCNHIEVSMPDADQILEMIKTEAQTWSQHNHTKVKADRKAIELLAKNLVGLSVGDVRRFVRTAIHDDGAITHSDVDEVMEAKYKIVANDSALTFEYDTAKFSDIGGFEKLFTWLKRRRSFFLESDNDNALDIPKGILLLGVQGCGKSLAAKSVAGEWGVPLLKLDMGALYNKYIGESERNIREALKAAELLEPCVLWMDEIEKAIQSNESGDSGTSNRLLGTLLTWMAENKSRVFFVATANDVTKLPPELMRKGRIDEIFFVDLPDQKSRENIFSIHLGKRELSCTEEEIRILASKADGFSGAEIEQAIASSRYLSHAKKEVHNSKHILEEIKNTRPLSVIRREEIEALRAWAKDRTVMV